MLPLNDDPNTDHNQQLHIVRVRCWHHTAITGYKSGLKASYECACAEELESIHKVKRPHQKMGPH